MSKHPSLKGASQIRKKRNVLKRFERINQLVADGKAVLMISSELPELLGMCDRIYVMNEGRLIAELKAEDASQEIIMSYIMQDSKGGIGA